MISAAEALTQPSAKLTDEQLEQVNKLEQALEEHVQKFMERRGVDFKTDIVDANVIAEINQRLKAAGYNTQWTKFAQKHRFNAAMTEVVGWGVNLSPSDEAYRAAR